MDINAAVGSGLGIPDEKLRAVLDDPPGPIFTAEERLALAYADAMTITGRDVDDALFARLRDAFGDDALVELTATIAWENASSTFNRALRVPSQGLWHPSGEVGPEDDSTAAGQGRRGPGGRPSGG